MVGAQELLSRPSAGAYYIDHTFRTRRAVLSPFMIEVSYCGFSLASLNEAAVKLESELERLTRKLITRSTVAGDLLLGILHNYVELSQPQGFYTLEHGVRYAATKRNPMWFKSPVDLKELTAPWQSRFLYRDGSGRKPLRNVRFLRANADYFIGEHYGLMRSYRYDRVIDSVALLQQHEQSREPERTILMSIRPLSGGSCSFHFRVYDSYQNPAVAVRR